MKVLEPQGTKTVDLMEDEKCIEKIGHYNQDDAYRLKREQIAGEYLDVEVEHLVLKLTPMIAPGPVVGKRALKGSKPSASV